MLLYVLRRELQEEGNSAASRNCRKAMKEHKTDRIYVSGSDPVKDFVFDDQVVEVFSDMIRRSVPGYARILKTIGKLANRFARPDSRIYDLGCSLGDASLVIRQTLKTAQVSIVAVDNSPAMIERARSHHQSYTYPVPIELQCADIFDTPIDNASMVILNFTLQFVAPERRAALLKKIYDGLNPGGLLVLSEKLRFEVPDIDALLIDLHHEFKRDNGYSELEISRKRAALEKVMRPDTEAEHLQRLQEAGFSHTSTWFQEFNFASLVAIK